jgi:hypothetical protein
MARGGWAVEAAAAWWKWWHTERQVYIVIIDEAEEFFRVPYKSGDRPEALSIFLKYSGAKSPYFTVVVATNFIGQIDDVVLRRFGAIIELPQEPVDVRLKILTRYLDTVVQKNARGVAGVEPELTEQLALKTQDLLRLQEWDQRKKYFGEIFSDYDLTADSLTSKSYCLHEKDVCVNDKTYR